jgi:hypothetical protein
LTINNELTENKEIHMIALDTKDVFGSVAYRLLDQSHQSIGFPQNIRKLLIDSCEHEIGNIINSGSYADKPINKDEKAITQAINLDNES